MHTKAPEQNATLLPFSFCLCYFLDSVCSLAHLVFCSDPSYTDSTEKYRSRSSLRSKTCIPAYRIHRSMCSRLWMYQGFWTRSKSRTFIWTCPTSERSDIERSQMSNDFQFDIHSTWTNQRLKCVRECRKPKNVHAVGYRIESITKMCMRQRSDSWTEVNCENYFTQNDCKRFVVVCSKFIVSMCEVRVFFLYK